MAGAIFDLKHCKHRRAGLLVVEKLRVLVIRAKNSHV